MISPDLKEFIALLNSHRVEYVIVGAHCVAFHGRPRYTGDLDIFVRPSADNAGRLLAALEEFGFGGVGMSRADFLRPNQVIQLGRAPNRIDLLTGLSGVDADEAFLTKVGAQLAEMPVFVLSKELLVRNKRATGRPQDLADLADLTGGD